MGEEKIKIFSNDWLFNSGIVGFINIVGEENVDIKSDSIEFSSDIFNGFEEKYFKYFIDTYMGTLSYNRIVAYKKTVENLEESEYSSLTLDGLKYLNSYIKDLKVFAKSNSYKAAYPLVGDTLDMLATEKKLKTIKEPKKEEEFEKNKDEIIKEVKERISTIKEVLTYMDTPKGKKYIAAKNVIYNFINKGWTGVSFLNSQTKEPDMYLDYKNYFIDPIMEYMPCDKTKYKYNCYECDGVIKDFKNDFSFLNNTGFDTSRKTSHIWDFVNDLAVCPICKLIYSCVPAGFTYATNKGIFVNVNTSLQAMVKVNDNIKVDTLKSEDRNTPRTYKALMETFTSKEVESVKYTLMDIQVVRYENENYRFNIISRDILEVIRKSKDLINTLLKANFTEVRTNFNLYEEVIKRLFNNENLYNLIHKALYYKLSTPKKCYFGTWQVWNMLRVNTKFLEVKGIMDEKNKNDINVYNAYKRGLELRDEYKKGNLDHNIQGFSYKMLNGLKTNNTGDFMDTILRSYMYVNKLVPKVIKEALKDEERLRSIGYSFISGFLGEEEKKKEDKDGGNE